MEILREAPNINSFVPLSDHQSTTPASFYSGPPVLHFHSTRCKILILERDLSLSAPLAALVPDALHAQDPGTNGHRLNAHTNSEDNMAEEDGQRIIEDVEVLVTSQKVLLFHPPTSTGLSIPYPTISLHAIQSSPLPSADEQQSQGLYMQLMLPSAQTGSFEDDDENMDSVSMTIIPPHVAAPPADQSEIEPREGHEETEAQNSTLTMFTALSNCSNLHPDLVDPNEPRDPELEHSTLYHAGLIAQGSTNGDLPPPMPGSGGWITAENMDEYFDAEGNWIGDENGPGLGPGAGTVRERESVQDDDANGEENTEIEETKWRKTS